MTCATIADRTPLHFAAQDNTVAVARLLPEYGADVNARNDHDNTPLREPIRRAGRGGRTTDDQGAERRPVRTPSAQRTRREHPSTCPP
ncbi:ankyrin repeat domain-containing protein [Gordonia paraffinivorans]|uniref:ankyrin repeat domain-containing protein n=1 Tax=Gordonia paraffinivorans TaxID=175628 RepID=UPI003FCCF2BD